MYGACGVSVNAELTPTAPAAHFREMSIEPGWMALRVEVAAPAADAVVNFLIERGATGVLTDDAIAPDGSSRIRLEAHVPSAEGPALAAAIRAYLHELGDIDRLWTAGPVDVAPVPAVDWEGVFRAHHTPIAIGRRLLIAPPWDVPDAPDRGSRFVGGEATNRRE